MFNRPKRGAILLHKDGSIYIALGNADASVVYEASLAHSQEIGSIQFGMADSDKVKVIGYIDETDIPAPLPGS